MPSRMRRNSLLDLLARAGVLPALIVLAACESPDTTGPAVEMAVPAAALLMEIPPVDERVLDETRIVRAKGKPVLEEIAFATEGFEAPFTLHVRNGDGEGNDRISSGELRLDGVPLLTSSDFNQMYAGVDLPVELGETGRIEVQVESGPGSYLSLWISGTPVASDGIRFCPDGSGDQSTLPGAIAAVDEGGTIRVCDGEWPISSVRIGKSLRLTAENPGRATLRVEGSAGLVVDAPESSTVMIEDLDFAARTADAGAFVVSAQPYGTLELRRARFDLGENTNGVGGRFGSSFRMEDVAMTGPEDTFAGLGLFVGATAFASVRQSTFDGLAQGIVSTDRAVESEFVGEDIRCVETTGSRAGEFRGCLRIANASAGTTTTLNRLECDVLFKCIEGFGGLRLTDSTLKCASDESFGRCFFLGRTPSDAPARVEIEGSHLEFTRRLVATLGTGGAFTLRSSSLRIRDGLDVSGDDATVDIRDSRIETARNVRTRGSGLGSPNGSNVVVENNVFAPFALFGTPRGLTQVDLQDVATATVRFNDFLEYEGMVGVRNDLWLATPDASYDLDCNYYEPLPLPGSAAYWLVRDGVDPFFFFPSESDAPIAQTGATSCGA